MKLRLNLFLAFILLSVTATDSFSFSESNSQKERAQQELMQLKQDIESLQKNLKSTRKKQSQAVTNLRNSEKQIATATKILRSTNRQLINKEQQLRKLRSQQTNLEKNKQQQKQALASQIKSAFVNGRQEYLKLLLNQQDPEALGRMLVYYDYMNKARSEKVAKLQKTLRELEQVDRDIQDEIRELNLLKQSKEEETERLKKLKSKRQQLVDALTKEIQNKTAKLTELQVNAKELQELIDSVREAIDKIDFSQPLNGLASVKGKMRWPTQGKKTLSYGSQLAEGLRSNGVVIAAEEGEAVNAVHHGRIVYADWLRGFGLLVIIDHGQGYMSLYGYNQALYKQVGDYVEAGEAIATVGRSGGQQHSGLYFELRRQGKPFNPRNWIR